MTLPPDRDVCSECARPVPQHRHAGRPRKTCSDECADVRHQWVRAQQKQRRRELLATGPSENWAPALVENAADRRALRSFNRFAKWVAP